ncbi:methylglyoxal reductase (NADPH-dependent) gre2 [Cladochytrium tenue]|nr:methylglyoxal reductase (NADPH-dependent) gre2 [Cladochytrium tenue]
MAASTSSKLVLVTGATGFIAAHVCRELLEQGYRVRGTLRTPAKGEHLRSVLPHPDRIEFVEVADLVHENAFDEAVKGVDYVIHCASPFHYNMQDAYRDLVDPAVKGTTGVLKSIAAHGPTVRRVVVTSSMASVRNANPKDPRGLTEADWNDGAIATLEANPKTVTPQVAYPASKTLAEKAAWAFVAESPRTFDLVTINPPFVYGPLLQKVDRVEDVNTSCKFIAEYLQGTPARPLAAGFVDVRDVALAHVRALTAERASGRRFIVSGGTHSHAQLVEALRRTLPADRASRLAPPAEPAAGPGPVAEISDAARDVLGINFRGLDETAKDTADSLIAALKL